MISSHATGIKSESYKERKWGHHEELVNKCRNLRKLIDSLDSLCCLNGEVAEEWAKIRPFLDSLLDQCRNLKRPPFENPGLKSPAFDRILMSIPGSDETWESIADSALVVSAVAATVGTAGAAAEVLPAAAAIGGRLIIRAVLLP